MHTAGLHALRIGVVLTRVMYMYWQGGLLDMLVSSSNAHNGFSCLQNWRGVEANHVHVSARWLVT